MRKVVGMLTMILGVFLLFADFSLGTSDTPKIESDNLPQNVGPATHSEEGPKISSDEPLFFRTEEHLKRTARDHEVREHLGSVRAPEAEQVEVLRLLPLQGFLE